MITALSVEFAAASDRTTVSRKPRKMLKNLQFAMHRNELIAPKTTSIGTGPVMCRARLGGVLKFYYREAA
jgi:hypothetical protein